MCLWHKNFLTSLLAEVLIRSGCRWCLHSRCRRRCPCRHSAALALILAGRLGTHSRRLVLLWERTVSASSVGVLRQGAGLLEPCSKCSLQKHHRDLWVPRDSTSAVGLFLCSRGRKLLSQRLISRRWLFLY